MLTTKLALAAALAAAAPPALDLPPVVIDLPPVLNLDPPPVVVDAPPVELPKLPAPPVPDVPSVPAPPPAPAAVPESKTAPATPAPASAATPTRPADPATPAGDRPARAAPRPTRTTRTAAARRRARAAAQPPAKRSAKARVERLVAATGGAVAQPRAAAPASESDSRPFTASVIDVVEDLPAAVLWALLGIAALALGLAGSAFWQSRQRSALEEQREELLGDIGLLSGALLPPVPDELDGLSVSAAYRPADGPAAGGDFYDVFCLGDGRVGILLGDVSGHGRDSVTQAALARYTLRTLLAAGHAPGAALAQADRLLARDLPPHFVTVVAAIYDPRTEVLTYAKAGHAPPIVLGAEHDPDAETAACPIGLGLGEVWPEFELTLSAGVSVCLYTDGLEDARLGPGRLGRDRVTEMLAAQDAPDATALLVAVGERADIVTDDTAAVVLTAREHHVVAVGA